MKRIVAVAIIIFLLGFGLPAYADNSNPPKILDVQIDVSRAYKSGDTMAIDILYSGGNPGLQTAELFFRLQNQIDLSGSRCFALDNWNASDPNYQNSIYGSVRPGVIRMLASVTSNCYPGANKFLAYVELSDKTGLRTGLKSFPFTITILDGKIIEAGTATLESKDSGFNLDTFTKKNSTGVISSTIILPDRTPEGFLVIWQLAGDANCLIKRNFPREVSNELVLLRIGTCKIVGLVNLDRSEFKNFSMWVNIEVLSAADKAAADKAAADADKAAADKAAADKAAADRAPAEKAAAEKAAADEAALANRKNQSITVDPFVKGSIKLKVKSIAIKASANSKLPLSVRTSTPDTCLYSNGKIQIKSIGRCVVAFSQDGNNEFKRAESKVLAFKIVKK